MTSFAFILGVLPLVIATGAGAEMRRTLGVAVFSGMLGVTLFGIFLTPVFFYVVRGLSGPRKPAPVQPVPGVVVSERHEPYCGRAVKAIHLARSIASETTV